MNCIEALQIMLSTTHPKRDEALAYIKSNPACLARIDQLGRAIVSEIEHEATCAETRLRMADYFAWQENDQRGSDEEVPQLRQNFPHSALDGVPQYLEATADHLGRCPYCQLEYQQLAETMAAFEAGTLPAVEARPTFNLSFITKPLPAMVPTREIWPIIGNIRTLFKEIEISISKSVATIATLTPQLAPLPMPVAVRGPDDPEYAILVLPDEDANIHFQFDSKPSPDGTALITLRVFDTESDKPIPDVHITLRRADGARVASSLADKDGTVIFPRIPPDRYIIKAEYDEKIWELFIAITAV